jgi:hypothetical protein
MYKNSRCNRANELCTEIWILHPKWNQQNYINSPETHLTCSKLVSCPNFMQCSSVSWVLISSKWEWKPQETFVGFLVGSLEFPQGKHEMVCLTMGKYNDPSVSEWKN